jgi:hypothetical protein
VGFLRETVGGWWLKWDFTREIFQSSWRFFSKVKWQEWGSNPGWVIGICASFT